MKKSTLVKILAPVLVIGASVIGGNYACDYVEDEIEKTQAMLYLGEIAGQKYLEANVRISTLQLLDEIATSSENIGYNKKNEK